jgi:transposase
VLAAADGKENKAIAQQVGADEKTVGKWRQRFAAERIDGLHDQAAVRRGGSGMTKSPKRSD